MKILKIIYIFSGRPSHCKQRVSLLGLNFISITSPIKIKRFFSTLHISHFFFLFYTILSPIWLIWVKSETDQLAWHSFMLLFSRRIKLWVYSLLYIYIYIYIYIQPLHTSRMQHKIGCHAKVKKLSLSYYLLIAGGRIISEMQTASSRFSTCFAVSISYNGNHYTTSASFISHISIWWFARHMNLQAME